MQISTIKNVNFEKPLRNPSEHFEKTIFFDISPKKFGSVYAQSPQNYSNFEILAKI
jgi:hypothetical protein